ncbi:MAG: FAD-binding oxidoreductase, partial [Trichodesmium sp. St2_bin6]|nr:FAD-binding oxidoreductase [Trichodesmium sp. St2_bin6]
QVMEKLGEPVLKPFLQDVVQFPALAQTLFVTSLKQPGLVIKIIPQVGIGNLLNWIKHYLNLGVYSFLYPIGGVMEGLTAKMSEEQRYYYNRWIEQWKYGSGGDYIE